MILQVKESKKSSTALKPAETVALAAASGE